MSETEQIRTRAPQRFVPTLTEVVIPDAPAAAVAAPAVSREMLEDIVNAAIQRVEADLSDRLPEALSVLLHEQALAVGEQMRREIRRSVQQAVVSAMSDAMSQEKNPDALRVRTPNRS